jgi:hypothetical protein
LDSWDIETLMGFCNHFTELQCMKDFGVVEELHQWSRLTQDLSGKPFFVLHFRKFWGALHTDRGQGEAWREREDE